MSAPPDTTNTAAVVVTYEPDEGLAARLEALSRAVARVVIVDNSVTETARQRTSRVAAATNAELLINSDNMGIGAALNQGASWALAKHFPWLLTLDQDTMPLPNVLAALGAAWGACPFREKAGVVGSRSENGNADSGPETFAQVVSVITSGSLINLAIWKSIQGFREDFFIDAVDEEYCLRLQREGFAVIEATQCGIRHSVGQPTIHRVFGRQMGVSNHPPTRRYFMTRNRIRLAMEYFADQPAWITRYFFYTIKDVTRMLLLESQRWKKFCAVILGIKDGLLNKLGPLRSRFLLDTRPVER
jgi:rhamnosyltransferase